MTNYEKIKSFTLEEMALFLCSGDRACEGCIYENEPILCAKGKKEFQDWLEREATE